MNILALDTATDVLSVALGKGDELWHLEADVGLRHSELLLPIIDTVLKTASIAPEDLNIVACMQGPGSFTGIRIGFSTAKGIAASLSIPFVAVPSLDCMAYPFNSVSGLVIPVIDAKRHRYFTAIYRQGMRICDYHDSSACDIAALIPPNESVLFTGPAAAMIAKEWGDTSMFTISSYYKRGNACTLLDCIREGYGNKEAQPLYIRKSDAQEKALPLG